MNDTIKYLLYRHSWLVEQNLKYQGFADSIEPKHQRLKDDMNAYARDMQLRIRELELITSNITGHTIEYWKELYIEEA